ncbi:MAG: MotA/TolQ/ExbB proton channel family protein [SAR324 cluster bacterium]|jgi:chemotaxis protein MotA|uniref:MotA/TolQ/ExbB proton channel domain-containing protein n=1 Tax=marine metagenome TaxID=408172 RepID=A0A381NEI1_9ZZZZ|nr:MotA/TolQ/ExbB proton channel family protein [SAR324 cluster bacterium]MDP7176232.1 MotA/TolQ/ExbB proton channel family protein [SAR324 cluster bacterium]MDP7583403.1 MotA/TolQ/ExbB proton channel family protein [SAR324 cluster bacterium]|tara:strand:- start:175 stop:1008 length:834 start_codon:yes stop_codon:yes gene_type:complete
MEQGTLVGTILAWFMLLFAMTFDFATFTVKGGNVVYFWDTPSLMIVFGGTIASTFISHPMGDAKGFLGIIGKSWKQNPVQLVETLTLIVDVSKIARKNILAIEDALPSIENLFLRGGLRLVVDRADREAIVEMMAHEVKYTMADKENEIAVVGTMASLCPAWGMLGTLVGLVLLLQNLDDPSAIGPAMAVALITTFYGSLFANTIFSPAKKKLELYQGEEKVLMEMIRDGVLYIEGGQRPDFIESDLMNYLPPAQKTMYEALKFEGGDGAAAAEDGA